MKFGMIGAGSMGTTLARHLVTLGHDISIASSRGPAELADVAVAHRDERRRRLGRRERSAERVARLAPGTSPHWLGRTCALVPAGASAGGCLASRPPRCSEEAGW